MDQKKHSVPLALGENKRTRLEVDSKDEDSKDKKEPAQGKEKGVRTPERLPGSGAVATPQHQSALTVRGPAGNKRRFTPVTASPKSQ